MDQMGEVEYAPGEPKGTPWHPHRGFETVTYMIDGTFQHQDSIGGGGLITNGSTQWMTAGSGILHIERPTEQLIASGGLFHGIQLWVNLPAADKWIDPRYQGIEARQRAAAHHARRRRAGPGHRRRRRRPPRARVDAHADLAGARHGRARRRARPALAAPSSTRSSTCSRATAPSGPTAGPFHTGQLAVHGPGEALVVRADADQESRHPALDVLILGGQPIGEPVYAHGPFVMNTRAEIVQAFEDFEAGKLGTVPADHIGNA